MFSTQRIFLGRQRQEKKEATIFIRVKNVEIIGMDRFFTQIGEKK